MKRIAVGTWYIGYNLGAVLQAYALNRFLNSLDDVEAFEIQYIENPKDANSSYKEIIMQLLHGHGAKTFVQRINMVSLCREKKALIDTFRENHICQSKPIIDRNTLTELNKEYDIFICGSDQIWNPHFLNTAYMFDYTDNSKIRISYAASLGVFSWPDEKKSTASKLLNRFSHISVREDKSVDILNKLSTVQDIKHVCDPVLLLTKDSWKSLAIECNQKNKNLIAEPFVFCYILNKNDKQISLIEKDAQNQKLKIVNLAHPAGGYCKADVKFGDIRLQAITPQEFVWLIERAETVYTDSFHCVMFSLIFCKDFYCFQRGDFPEMNVRVDSILKTADIQNRGILDTISHEQLMKIKEIDYEKVAELLAVFRNTSIEWLRMILKE